MKRFLFTLSLILVSATAIISLCSWDYAPSESISHNSANISADDDWILIGEVTLFNYNNSSETIKANLYVREIAQNLIYRVEYQGSYYATRWHDYSQTYHVTINGKTYRCDVPAISNGSSSDNKTGLQRFVGVWKSSETDFGDIQIIIKENKLFLQQKTAQGLKSSFPSISNDVIEWSFEINEDYGKWNTQYTSSGNYIILGDGLTWQDKAIALNISRNRANREILKYNYSGRLKNGNLEITREYSYIYYYDRDYAFYWKNDLKARATYTQW